MKHQYEDYIKFVDDKIHLIDEIVITEIIPTPEPEYSMSDVLGIARKSLLANRAVLERHKGHEAENVRGALLICRADEDLFPCPTYTDVTDQIRSVMN